MKYLYLDNFRGFSDTTIPIEDVNFLVGQNSTGKTSFLALFHLVTTMQFWFTQDFNSEQFTFGNFSDIVSVHSEDRRYFHIGVIEYSTETKNDTSKSNFSGFVATFREFHGLPQLTRFTVGTDENLYTLSMRESGVFYKSSTKYEQIKDLQPSEIFKNWIAQQNRNAGFKKLLTPESKHVDEHTPLPYALYMVQNLPEAGKREKGKITLSFPHAARISEVVWMAPIRTKPLRTYDQITREYSPEGLHTPYVIKKILDHKSDADQFLSAVNEFGKASGLFESVTIRRFGRGTNAPFEVDIVLDRKALSLSSVGYGVSQALPVLVELLIRSEGTWFVIQQPEIHLHPRAQAALGDLFFRAASRENKCFLIETHSDFMIDRFRMNFRRRSRKRPSAQVLFFERQNQKNVIHKLPIGAKGDLPRSQPGSYREFFVKEEFRLLGI